MTASNVKAPELLVSIRDPDELAAAVQGGADWIDLKEPGKGALAAVDRMVAEAAVAELAGRRTLSAALGELSQWECSESQQLLDIEGISIVKLGLSGCGQLDDWSSRWSAVARQANMRGKQLAAVVYADWQRAQAPSPGEVIALARRCAVKYLLIDTFVKDGRKTFDFLPISELAELLKKATESGLTTVLAGSLEIAQIKEIPQLLVDIVAVRGAVCRGDRTTQVEAALVNDFRCALRAIFCRSDQAASALPESMPR